jgi:hypothetical protein
MTSEMISGGLKAWGEARDLIQEQIFLNTYGSPWLQAMVGLRADTTEAHQRIERDVTREANAGRAAAYLQQHLDRGGLLEATVRALLYVRMPEGKADERGFAALSQIAAEMPAAKRIGFDRFKELVKQQFLVLFLDEQRAVAAIPHLLPEERDQRAEALTSLRRVLAARGDLAEESERRFKHIEAMFAGGADAVGAGAQAAAK